MNPVAVRIPLFLKRALVAYATVDAANYHLVAPYVWHLHNKGYAAATGHPVQGRRGRTVLMHRLVLGLTEADQCSDHINQNKLDNRRSNLRVLTAAQNNQNRRGKRGSTSAFKGVHFRAGRKPWLASVKAHGKRYCLGAFATEREAAEVAAAKRAELQPFSQDARPSSSALRPICSGDESARTGA